MINDQSNAASSVQAIQKLNQQFLKKLIDQWTNGPKHHDYARVMSEYQNFAERLSNDESVSNEPCRFTPCNPGLAGKIAKDIVEQVAKEGCEGSLYGGMGNWGPRE